VESLEVVSKEMLRKLSMTYHQKKERYVLTTGVNKLKELKLTAQNV
jgi:hypothetical protein